MGDTGTNKSNHIFKIHAETGKKRLIEYTLSQQVAAFQQFESDWWWDDSVSELVGIRATASTSATGVFDWKLYKRKSNRSIDAIPMRTVAEIPVNGNFSAGATISGINGDRIDVIKIEYLGYGGSAGSDRLVVRLNGDGAGNYHTQTLRASGASASAFSDGADHSACRNYISTAANSRTEFSVWIYPKSGKNRPVLSQCGYSDTVIQKTAGEWNNSVSELISIDMLLTNNTGAAPTDPTITGLIRVSVPKNTKQATGSFAVTIN
jgi:hypothetical protein